MSLDQIESNLAALIPSKRDEVAAFLFHLRHAADAEYQETVARRLADSDPAHWLTLEEFESRLDQ